MMMRTAQKGADDTLHLLLQHTLCPSKLASPRTHISHVWHWKARHVGAELPCWHSTVPRGAMPAKTRL